MHFKGAFYTKYLTSSRMAQLERQFLHLTQDNMRIQKYEAEFDRLSRYAPTQVDTDASNAYEGTFNT